MSIKINMISRLMAKSVFAFLAIILSNCNSPSQTNIYAISLNSDIDFINMDRQESITMKDSVVMFFFMKYTLIKVPFKHYSLSSDDREGIGNDTVLLKHKEETIEHIYILFKNGDKYGLKFNSPEERNGNKVNVDSFFSKKAFFSFKNFYDDINDSLILVVKEDGKVKETYIPKIKYDESYNDTTYLYFDEALNSIEEFSFSKVLDNTKKLKLVKIRLVYNALPATAVKPFTPRREFRFEMKKAASFDNKKIASFINSHKLQLSD